MNPQSPAVDFALKVRVALEAETFLVPLEKQCKVVMEVTCLSSDFGPAFASSMTLDRACTASAS